MKSDGGVTRREFLVLSGLGLALAGCAPTPSETHPASPSIPPTAIRSVRQLIKRESFVVAHRGSGDNWPEHTLKAYQGALGMGAQAVEISVCATADGVLICHHDLSGQRVLGVEEKIEDLTWDDVRALSVDATRWLGVNTPLEPVARLDDVLSALGDSVLVFVEDKQGTNTAALLDMMDEQPRSTERFVWKQWARAGQLSAAKSRGYLAWGYFEEDDVGSLDEFASNFDILGVPAAMSDDAVSRAVRTGVPVMAWPVRLRTERERLVGLGVVGLMCANVPYLMESVPPATQDAFDSGQRAPGDLPSGIDQIGWYAQPAFVPGRDAVRIERTGACSYLLGSMSSGPGDTVSSIRFTLQWPDAVPKSGTAGVAFSLSGDAQGGDGDRGAASGFELHLNGEGELAIHERVDGQTRDPLVTATVAVPRVGQPFTFVINLTEGQIEVLDGVSKGRLLAAKRTVRPGGTTLRLFKTYETAPAVEFSDITVSSRE